MPPETYRYYRLDGAGHLDDAEWFNAANDADAIAQTSASHPDVRSEIWQGSRLVAKLSPEHFDPDDRHAQQAVGDRLSDLAPRLARRREIARGAP